MGLTIGGTLTLMSLGVGGYAGTSVPNYDLGAVTGTLFAIASTGGIEAGLAVGIPVAALGTQFDVLVKMMGSYFIRGEREAVKNHEFNKIGLWVHGWTVMRAVVITLPVLFVMTAGADLILNLLNIIPAWVMSGFGVAAGLLPAVGFALLLKNMSLEKYGVFLIFGYVLAGYLGMNMLGVSLLALVAGVLIFNGLEEKSALSMGGNEDE